MAWSARAPSMPAVRGSLRRAGRRLSTQGWAVAQTALAAAVAWGLAGLLHETPFFAPISAVIALGIARGQRTRRAFELVLGVALGIAVADLIVIVLGTGTAVIALVVALAMIAALLLNAGALFVSQAATSAILVVTLEPPTDGLSPDRFIDCLIGGAVALLVSQVLFPRDPVRAIARAAAPVASDLAVALEAVAQGLREGDVGRARRGLDIARASDDDLAALYDAVARARETVSMLPPARRARERLPLYADAAPQIDYAVRNTRVLARRAIAAIRRDGAAPPELADAVSLLGDGVTALAEQLDDPQADAQARRLALEAAARATAVLSEGLGLSYSVIVGQIRSTAVDLLRGSGLSTEEAHRALERSDERDD